MNISNLLQSKPKQLNFKDKNNVLEKSNGPAFKNKIEEIEKSEKIKPLPNKSVNKSLGEKDLQENTGNKNITKNKIDEELKRDKEIAQSEVFEMLKEIADSNSPTNDLLKILKLGKVFQNIDGKLEEINQLQGNELVKKLEELIEGLENHDMGIAGEVQLKKAFLELSEILKNMDNGLEGLSSKIVDISEMLSHLQVDGKQQNWIKEISDFVKKLEDNLNEIEEGSVTTGKIQLMDDVQVEIDGALKKDEVEMEGISKTTDNIEFVLGNDNKSIDKMAEKGVKYQELSLDQLKKEVGDKLNEIQKLITAKDKMLIQLNPKNLGNLEIFIQKTNDSIEISIEFEKKIAKVQLELILDEVKKDFKDRNVELNFTFAEKDQAKDENSKRKDENDVEERKLNHEEETVKFDDMISELLGGI